jgi:hypothetical protein
MALKSIHEAGSLVGKTFEREGKRREVTKVSGLKISEFDGRTVLGDIFWKVPGGNERKAPTKATDFGAWLSKASEVSNEMEGQILTEDILLTAAISAATNQANRKIEKLEADLQRAVNERNEAWFQLEEAGIRILRPGG